MRTPPKPLSAYPWQSRHDLRFADLDPLGHINNGAYGSLMESNRAALFTSCGLMRAVSVALVRIEMDFLKEMHWPGEAVAASGFEHVGRSSFRLRQGVFKDGVCTAQAVSTLCLLNLQTRRAEAISDALRADFARWALVEQS